MSFASGFLAGAGEQLTEVADNRLKRYAEADLAAERQAAELAKEKRLEEHQIRNEGRQDTRDTAKRGLINQEKRDEEKAEFTLKNSPERVAIENATAASKAAAKGKTDIEQATDAARAGATPEMLKIMKDKAEATRAPERPDRGAGLLNIQIETARLSLDEKKKVNALMAEAETTKDPERKAAIIQSLTMRGIIKPGEFDTENVSTETMNPDGSTSKTERTQKRQAGQAPNTSVEKPSPGGKMDTYRNKFGY